MFGGVIQGEEKWRETTVRALNPALLRRVLVTVNRSCGIKVVYTILTKLLK